MRHYKLIYIFCFSFLVFACQDNNKQNETIEEEEVNLEETETAEMDAENTISDRIEDEEELRIFSTGMTRAGLSDDFSEGEGPFTIFAPSNVAFEGITEGERDEYDSRLANMYYLVVERELPAAELRQSINDVGGNMELITMQGERLIASIEGDSIVLKDGFGNTATITQPDRDASNGVVHIIDGILRPQDLDRIDFPQEDLDTLSQ